MRLGRKLGVGSEGAVGERLELHRSFGFGESAGLGVEFGLAEEVGLDEEEDVGRTAGASSKVAVNWHGAGC